MAKEIKRQSLLNAEQQKIKVRKRAPQGKPKVAAAPTPEALAEAKALQEAKVKRKQKLLGILGGVILLALIISPKPKLVRYSKGNTEIQSVYLPGWFGTPGRLLDSSAKDIEVNSDKDYFYICHKYNKQKDCQRYQVIEVKGMMAALWRLVTG